MPADLKDLKSVILEKMGKTEVPGLCIAVVEGDRALCAMGFGFEVCSCMHAEEATRQGKGVTSFHKKAHNLCAQTICAA